VNDLTPKMAALLDGRLESIRNHPERLIAWEDTKRKSESAAKIRKGQNVAVAAPKN
jgi:hypothetical protein